MTRATIAAALLCSGCGNYSTEDLEFLAALPQREDLRAEVPSGGTSGAATVCPIGEAKAWLQAKPQSDGWNAGVELVIGLIDVVRGFPPTWRRDDARGWGPFPDERHPGREIQVRMDRDYPPELAGKPRYRYAFQARLEGTEAFTDLITGAFEGRSSATGRGFVSLDFEAFWALGMNNPDTPHGTIPIEYDRTGQPVRIFLTSNQPGFDAPIFTYAFRGWQDGSGRFGYRFRDLDTSNQLDVVASYRSDGAGRGYIQVTRPAPLSAVVVRQCWDASACLVFVDDPLNVTGACPSPPCGSELVCEPVREAPEAPFDPIQLAQ